MNNLPLRFWKAGKVWCGGARENHCQWVTEPRVTLEWEQNRGVFQISLFFLDPNGSINFNIIQIIQIWNQKSSIVESSEEIIERRKNSAIVFFLEKSGNLLDYLFSEKIWKLFFLITSFSKYLLNNLDF